MEHDPKKQSPLEMLVAYQQAQNVPVKAIPKSRFEKDEQPIVVVPTVEDPILKIDTIPADKRIHISNSSLVVNFSINVDSEAIDNAFEKSKEVAKSLAAASAAVLGTAFFFNATEKKASKVKIPLMPKVKIPKIRRSDHA